MQNCIKATFVAAALMLTPQAATAASQITVPSYPAQPLFRYGAIDFAGDLSRSLAPASASYLEIGQYRMIGVDENNQPLDFLTWCVDLYHNQSGGTYLIGDIAVAVSDTARANALLALIGNNPMPGTADASAAMQLAVWEIVYEATGANWNVTSGLFSSGEANGGGDFANALTLANGYLGNVANNIWQTQPGTSLASLTQEYAQDQVTLIPSVPEPATWAMMIAGFGAVGWAARRRRRRAALS